MFVWIVWTMEIIWRVFRDCVIRFSIFVLKLGRNSQVPEWPQAQLFVYLFIVVVFFYLLY